MMKKVTAVILALLMAVVFLGCGTKSDGDLGKRTTVDKSNGYSIIQEVLPFEYSEDKKAFDENTQLDGFKTSEENPGNPAKTKSAALEIAKQEVTDSFDTVKFSYDRTRGIWKVTFILAATNNDDGSQKTEERTVKTVYVDEDGYAVAAVK